MVVLLVSFAVGAAALAAWFYVRFPTLAPADIRRALIHVGVAFVVTLGASQAVASLIEPGAPVQTFATLFALALPTIVYTFLTGFWFLRVCQGMLSGSLR